MHKTQISFDAWKELEPVLMRLNREVEKNEKIISNINGVCSSLHLFDRL